MKMKVTEQELQSRIDKLPKDISPDRDLWQGIERAIQNNSQQASNGVSKKPFMTLAWAASIVAAVLLTWGTIVPQNDQTPDLVNILQDNFEQQKQTMLVSFGKPDVTKLPVEMQEQLAKLASARESIKKALVDDPNNGDLLNLLDWTQQQELELLEQLYSPQWQSI